MWTISLLLLALAATLVVSAPSASLETTVEHTVCKAGIVSLNDVIKIATEAEVTKKEMSEMKARLEKQCPADGTNDAITMGLDTIARMQKQALTEMKRLLELVSAIEAGGGPSGSQGGGTTAATLPAGGMCFTPERTCYSGYGHHYRGTVAVTFTGKTCQRWDAQSPHSHTRNTRYFPHDDLVENYCRNPDYEAKPWCYTTDPSTRFELCNIPSC